jgi:hypothetical protein
MVAIPCKTAAARAELASEQRRLSQRHRTLLLLIDGQRSLDEVLKLAAQAGVPRGYIDELLALGFIVMTAAAGAFPMDGRSSGNTDLTPWMGQATAPMPFADAQDTLGLGVALTNTELAALDLNDAAMAEARSLLLSALRSAAPWASSVTQLRLRRARRRQDLLALLPEVQNRLSRTESPPQVRQLISQVQQLLTWQVPL